MYFKNFLEKHYLSYCISLHIYQLLGNFIFCSISSLYPQVMYSILLGDLLLKAILILVLTILKYAFPEYCLLQVNVIFFLYHFGNKMHSN